MTLHYFLRKPELPMLGSIDGCFVAGKTLAELETRLAEVPLNRDGEYKMIDCNCTVWNLYTKEMTLSPLCFDKRKTKLEIIRMFNQRLNTDVGQGRLYSEKSLASKRLDKVFADLVALAALPVKLGSVIAADRPVGGV